MRSSLYPQYRYWTKADIFDQCSNACNSVPQLEWCLQCAFSGNFRWTRSFPHPLNGRKIRPDSIFQRISALGKRSSSRCTSQSFFVALFEVKGREFDKHIYLAFWLDWARRAPIIPASFAHWLMFCSCTAVPTNCTLAKHLNYRGTFVETTTTSSSWNSLSLCICCPRI